MKGVNLVLSALRAPGRMSSLTPAEWDLMLRQARHADLLGRLAMIADARSLLTDLPAGPRGQLEAARVLTQAQQRETRRELAHIADTLAPLGISPVLLKGAAYLASGGPAALGRSCSDIDLLVEKSRLPEVESQLMMGGWVTTHLDPYDQRYYREWMHELPPMEHATRHTVIDVHHAILPDSARPRPDPAALLGAALSVSPRWRILSPTDMVLHCIVHLLQNEEFSHGLRDLSDLDLMLRHFGHRVGFWDALVPRGRQLQVARPLHYGLQLAHQLLGTPVPEQTLRDAADDAPRAPTDRWMQSLWRRALIPDHHSLDQPSSRLARGLLYLRAHWMRMPPGLLLRHLAVKGGRRLGGARAAPA